MKTTLKHLCLVLLLLFIIMPAAGCRRQTADNSAAKTAIAPGPYDHEKILVHGLIEQDFEIILGDLKKLPTVSQHAQATRSNGEKISVTATGPLLDTFLQKYGKTQKDFTSIRFSAKDKYSIAVPENVLQNRPIILSYINDGKPLPDEWQPIRIVIPGERAMYWVKDMVRMDFTSGEVRETANRVVFLETAVRSLPAQDYKYYDSTDQAVKTSDLISKFAGSTGNRISHVFMKASDGLQKDETKTNFLAAYIKINGKDSPKFLSPQLPQGMHIRDLLYIIYGQTAFFDYAQGIKSLPRQTAGDTSGLALSQIVKQTGLSGGNSYRFISADGKSVEILTTELGNGLIFMDKHERLGFMTDSNSGKKVVEDLLSIEVLK